MLVHTATALFALDGDVNLDGLVNATDVQLTINAVLGHDVTPHDADANGDGNVDALDVQLVINRVLMSGS